MEGLKKVAIYRVVFGPYDRKIEDHISGANYDLYLFTDSEQVGFSDYKRVMLPVAGLPALKNRELKINVPQCLRDYDVVIYIDANIQICRNIAPLIDEFLESDADFGFFRHPYSESIEDEIQAVLKHGKAKPEMLRKELEELGYSAGETGRAPFTENSILIRRNFARWDDFAAEWYRIVRDYSGRDQISLPFLRKRFELKEHIIPWSPRIVSNKYFVVFQHKRDLKKGVIKSVKSELVNIKKTLESFSKRHSLNVQKK